jgi:hypothetical protein
MFRWEFPTVLSEVDVPGEFETNGIPNRFRALVVALSGDQAYRFFNESFVKQGLYVAPQRHQMEMAEGQFALTGYDAERQVTYTVFLTPYDDGTTGVIAGEAFFKGRSFSPGAPFVPVMAEAEGVVLQNLEVGRSMVFRVKSTVLEATAFYAEVFRERGYEDQGNGTWVSGRSVLHLVVSPSAVDSRKVDVGVVENFGNPPQ